MKQFFCLLTILLLTQCGRDLEVNLGNEYYYTSEGRQRTYICKWNNKNHIASTFVVMPSIQEYAYDNNFILVYRLITFQMEKFYADAEDDLWNKQKGDNVQFWIIEKKNDKVYGPLKKDNFKQLKDSLKISEHLKLDEAQ